MRPFSQIAIPHEDILEGRFTMDIFAADLWGVVRGDAPLDYVDPDLFFRKTYFTKGLRNIIEVAKARLNSKIGDSVVQLQTPFGGGKTHTLIALYHKAKEWNAKVVVFDGTAFNPAEVKPWEEIERQLTGKVILTRGSISPGKEKLVKLLSESSPVLILMDEVLEYVTKAAGIKVGDSNLASQTYAFLQELTAAVSTVGNALLVLTLPSSTMEHYDENAERMFQQLQKILGRVERIYAPVEDEEIEYVVRARLFSKIHEKDVKKVVDDFIEYAKSERLLSGDEVASYRERFLRSYPFKPEVIDVLYKRWGSFPMFQRTRGVLRLLSLVVHDLLDKNVPFIRLGDFNLNNSDIRRELIKHIGQEWDSIIAQDITSRDAGARKVDDSLGSSYKPYSLGTVVSTTIFMMSFSGRGEKGSSVKEIKLSTVYPEFSSTVIDTVISNLRERLFYLSDESDKELLFTNQPNLNRMIIVRMENIPESVIYEEERKVIEKHISNKSRVYIHPKFPKDIPDTPSLKLVILDKSSPEIEFLERYGDSPRVYRNILIFLCTDESQKDSFYAYLRKLLALRSIHEDKKLKLTEGQRRELKNKLKDFEGREYEELRKFYRRLFLPRREGYKEIYLGLPTFGESFLDREIYEHLREQGEILEKISPKVIKAKYLAEKKYLEIRKLYEAFLKTPGEIRLISEQGFIESIKKGVSSGLFGFGYLSGDDIECKCINEIPNVNLDDNEVIVKPELCEPEDLTSSTTPTTSSTTITSPITTTPPSPPPPPPPPSPIYSKVSLKLKVPIGQLSTIARVASYLGSRFRQCDVEVSIHASQGEIKVTEYEDKIMELLLQANVEIVEEDK